MKNSEFQTFGEFRTIGPHQFSALNKKKNLGRKIDESPLVKKQAVTKLRHS